MAGYFWERNKYKYHISGEKIVVIGRKSNPVILADEERIP